MATKFGSKSGRLEDDNDGGHTTLESRRNCDLN